MNYAVDTDLLIKYFSGLASPEEGLRVDEWRQLNEENKLYFEELSSSWNKEQQYIAPDVAAKWKEFEQKTSFQQTTAKPKSKALRWWPYAAAIAVLVIVGLLWQPTINQGDKIISEYIGINKEEQIFLDKMARVSLVKDAKLTRLNNDSLGSYYKLIGPASFWVGHGGDSELKIQLPSGIWLRDIGTIFSIEGDESKAKITVNDGIVEVWHATAKQQVNKNQVLTYDKTTNDFIVKDLKGNFNYKDYPLQQACDSVGKYFNTAIKIEGASLKNKMITLNGSDLSLAEVLEIITTTLDINHDSTPKDTIVFKAK